MITRWYQKLKPGRMAVYGTCMVVAVAASTLSFTIDKKNEDRSSASISRADSLASQKAFLQVYKVLMSPRCMNCHPSGDIPLNGDDNHLHPQGVKRGMDGKGLYALKCSNCHQTENTPGLNMPPGAEDWHLPPSDMRMVFQGKSAHDLAMQMKDPKRNGGKSFHDLKEHLKTDLVKWGWKPGAGRSMPSISYAEFVKQFTIWLDKGAVAPAKGKG